MMNSLKDIAKEISALNGGAAVQSFQLKQSKKTKFIINNTQFLLASAGLKERAYCIINSITSIPTCNVCSNKVKWQITRYTMCCSKKCSTRDISRIKKVKKAWTRKNRKEIKTINDKRETTCLNTYGVTHSSKDPIVYEKKKKTWVKNLGVDNPSKSKKIKQKKKKVKLQKYGDENYNNREKAKETCLKRYNRNHTRQQHISEDSWIKLNDKRWLKEQHHDNYLSLSQIGDILDVSDVTVGNYLHYYGLKTLYRGGYNEQYFETYPEMKTVDSHLYIIHCYNDTESFIKIGITMSSIKSRYYNFQYQYKILLNLELSLYVAFKAEQDILNQFRQYSYQPGIKFGGKTECLKEECLNDLLEYIKY